MVDVFPSAPDDFADATAGPDLDDDYVMVMLLAVGLLRIHLARWDGPGRPLRAWEDVLPIEWRLGSARLWWRCMYAGVEPPASELDLFSLCRQPFESWPIALNLTRSDLENSLLEGDEVTEFTEQAARLLRVPDVDAELRENKIIAALRRTVTAHAEWATPAGPGPDRDSAAQDAYVALRSLILRSTFLTGTDWRQWCRRFPVKNAAGQPFVTEFLRLAYDVMDAPPGHRINLCPVCKNVLSSRSIHCGTAGCLSGTPDEVTVDGRYFVLERSARRFIHDPGLIEARIFDALVHLEAAGSIRVTPYPRLDSLDVLVEFLHPGVTTTEVVETWGIDAKDQRSARNLGRDFQWPAGMDCTRRFIVIPDHRCRGGYLDELRNELSGRGRSIEVIQEKHFLTQVTSRAKEIGS